MRDENILGLIGRSHSPAQAQTEEREERRRFDWDYYWEGYFPFIYKKDNRITEKRQADHLYITETVTG